MKKILFGIMICMPLLGIAQKFDSLALTPPMGWNSWNTFEIRISEQLVKDMADKMVSSGMRDAGYNYLVLDDGWMAMERDKSGNLVADPQKFPHGMKAVSDYVHSKGLKFGLYNCAGTLTCAHFPGTRGHEYQDARLYASWEIDYLKFDWCSAEGLNAKEAYTTMSRAIKEAGHPMVFSICEWGRNQPWEWGKEVGHLWRTTTDICVCFDSIRNMGQFIAWGAVTIMDAQEKLRKYAGPGHWNDPDMLEVGKGMSAAEDRAHFSLWCMMAAPLIAGNDLRSMTPQTASILTNKELIAVDQDKLGIQGFRYSSVDSVETWIKPLKGGDWAVCFFNRSSVGKAIDFDWSRHAIFDSLTGSTLDATTTMYQLKNLWQHKEQGTTDKAFKDMLASHDVIVLRLTKQKSLKASTTIRPGQIWQDDKGDHIQAHGGGIIKIQSTYYWYGEERRKGLDTNFRYVSCYSSPDLVNWKFRGQVTKMADPENLGYGWILERPKVFYNSKSRKYVMYFHLDDRTYKFARIGIAVSDKPDGNFTYVKSFRPMGHESRDIGQFIDDDGTAYLIFEDRPLGFHIVKLSDDYMDIEKEISLVKEPMEGGAIVHYNGLYYSIGSALTGWKPNPNKYATSKSLEGPWSAFRDIAPPNTNTYNSQSTMLIKVAGEKDTTVVFMADQWHPEMQWDSRYLWMPLEIGDGDLRLPAPQPWKLNVKSGKWSYID